MKRLALLLILVLPLTIVAQQPILIDHSCLDLSQIPNEWIESAKENLYIGYGHTSHGSQLTSGMSALEEYFEEGTFDWSHEGGPGELHLFEGAGYGSGYLELDCGYQGWDNQTRTYLDDHPECNVIIWSWCGQVNNVDLFTHYLDPMDQLEFEYPDVKFVYMTGHLEGEGTGGSLYLANQQIRDFCLTNNKILFDFADIERYDPDSEVNYQDYFADDACNYTPAGGGTDNWADNWLAANPDHELTELSQLCGSCAHSVSLNCVKKGIACWYLWAKLAGWEGPATIIENQNPLMRNYTRDIKIYPNPARHYVNIVFPETVFCNTVEIWDLRGRPLYSKLINESHKELEVTNINVPAGVYVVRIVSNNNVYKGRISFN